MITFKHQYIPEHELIKIKFFNDDGVMFTEPCYPASMFKNDADVIEFGNRQVANLELQAMNRMVEETAEEARKKDLASRFELGEPQEPEPQEQPKRQKKQRKPGDDKESPMIDQREKVEAIMKEQLGATIQKKARAEGTTVAEAADALEEIYLDAGVELPFSLSEIVSK
jgi:hypothetical protein